MRTRRDLHIILKKITDNVYFQPPESLKIIYPCIIYSRDYKNTQYADNLSYIHKNRYSIIVIDKDPDSLLPDKVADLPCASFSRHYTSDNLNHDAFDLYF